MCNMKFNSSVIRALHVRWDFKFRYRLYRRILVLLYYSRYIIVLHHHTNLLNRSDHLHNRKKQQLHNNRHILSRRLARPAHIHVCLNWNWEIQRTFLQFTRARHFIFKQWRVKLGIKLRENSASLLASAATSLNFSFCVPLRALVTCIL